MKPGLAMNSSAVLPSNNAQVALPGEMMSSYSTIPTNVNTREPLSAFTVTSSPRANPPSCAVSVSSTMSLPPSGRRPSARRQTDSSPSLIAAPKVGAVGRSIGVPSLAMTTASPCTAACASATPGTARISSRISAGSRSRRSRPNRFSTELLLCT